MIHDPAWDYQRRTFEQTAEAYDRYRPSYPQALYDDIRAYADLAPDDQVLEIGCGTGRGTVFFAEWGNPVLAIEPAPAMADVARRNLASFESVEVRTARFEDAGMEHNSFGLAACVQAWHWLDPETRIQRFADVLYAHGTAAIIGNIQVAPEDNLPFWVRVQEVYREHTPEMMHQGDFRKPDEMPEHPLDGSSLFYDLAQIGHAWHWTLNTEDYLGLCATHSAKAALEPEIRHRLLAGIGELIDAEFGGHVTEHYVALAGVARRA
ncbi:MAG: class I SAM-dependent methyltransferase [Actinomycetota bacterium]